MNKWSVWLWAVLGMLIIAACSREEPAKKAETTAPARSTERTAPPVGEAPRIIEVTLSFVPPRFRPDPIIVQVGKPVQFQISSADTRHTLIIESLGIEVEVPQKALNESVTTKVVTPQEVGTFRMFCRIHERLPMEGTLQVVAGEAPSN